MRRDIVIVAERRIDGRWELAQPLSKNAYFDPDRPWPCPEIQELAPTNIYPYSCHYEVHAMLGDERWPSKLQEGITITPISETKDIPDDISPTLREYLIREWEWGASFPNLYCPNWYTLAELLAFPWEEKLIYLIEQGAEPEPVGTYADFAGFLLSETLPLLQTFGPPEEIRIVLWLDG